MEARRIFKKDEQIFNANTKRNLKNEYEMMSHKSHCKTQKKYRGGVFPMGDAKEAFQHFLTVGRPNIEFIGQNSLFGVIMKIHQPNETDPEHSFYRLTEETMLKSNVGESCLEKVDTLCVKIAFSIKDRELTDMISLKKLVKGEAIIKRFSPEVELDYEVYSQNMVAAKTSVKNAVATTPFIVFSKKYEVCEFDDFIRLIPEVGEITGEICDELRKLDSSRDPKIHVLAMEFLKNSTSAEAYKDDKPKLEQIGICGIYELMRSIVESRVMHLDLHYGNIMYTADTGRVQLIDYGQAIDMRVYSKTNKDMFDEIVESFKEKDYLEVCMKLLTVLSDIFGYDLINDMYLTGPEPLPMGSYGSKKSSQKTNGPSRNNTYLFLLQYYDSPSFNRYVDEYVKIDKLAKAQIKRKLSERVYNSYINLYKRAVKYYENYRTLSYKDMSIKMSNEEDESTMTLKRKTKTGELSKTKKKQTR